MSGATFSAANRKVHRWVSCLFTLTVVANFVALGASGGVQPHWAITYAPLPPLLVLMLSGTWMFLSSFRRPAQHGAHA